VSHADAKSCATNYAQDLATCLRLSNPTLKKDPATIPSQISFETIANPPSTHTYSHNYQLDQDDQFPFLRRQR